MKGDNGLGLRQIDGVNFESYTNATNIRIVEGRPLPESGDAVIVDIRYATIHNINPGDCINIFNREVQGSGSLRARDRSANDDPAGDDAGGVGRRG